MVRIAPDGTASTTRWPCRWPQAGASVDGQDGVGADLPAATHDGTAPGHRIWPYLLRDLVVERPDQAWCADITYIPMRRGFLCLVAVMDWATRRVLAWRVSNTMDVEFCIDVLEEALAMFGPPEIFNTDSKYVPASYPWAA